ncbi:MAG TPA: DUF302 domain-containing protein [Nitrospiraceae bacterium]|nr:DUF302 domain-containing protein [Nitrospiraceae bacterium]
MPSGGMPANGIARVPSKYSVPETIHRLESVVKSHGLTVFAHIDFSGDAAKVGLKMPPAQLLIFGNPKAGTPLMIASPSIAIDLPLKALAQEDADGKVWLSYNQPVYLKERHGVPDELVKNISGIGALVERAAE